MAVIYPVVMPVPPDTQELSGRAKVARLSALARKALFRSAEISGVSLDRLEKDDRGAPLPFGDTYWSISHKETYVAGVTAPAPVGIDVEKVRSCNMGLYRKTGTDREWALGGRVPDDHLFFRYWTAKETVLKTTGAGFREFSHCRIHRIVDDRILQIDYRGREWLVEQVYFHGHMAAVVKDGWEIRWQVINAR